MEQFAYWDVESQAQKLMIFNHTKIRTHPS